MSADTPTDKISAIEELPEMTDRAIDFAVEGARMISEFRVLAERALELRDSELTSEERAAAEETIQKIDELLEQEAPGERFRVETGDGRTTIDDELLPDGPVFLGEPREDGGPQ